MNRQASPQSLDDGFERLRQVFNSRLCGDRVRLLALGSALTRVAADPAPILAEIQTFAHKLRGAAAIFENADIGPAAKSLELAAIAASVGLSETTEPSVGSALATLVERLPTANASGESTVPAGAPEQADD